MIRRIALALALAAPVAAQPPAVPPPAPAGDTYEIALADGPDWGLVPYDSAGGLILLAATINGQPATLLLDNGTERTVIDAAFVGAPATVPTEPSQSAGLAVQRVDDVTLVVPHAVTVRGTLLASDLRPIAATLGRPVAAVLGADVLERVALAVRPAERRLALVPSGGANPTGAATIVPLVAGDQVAAEIDGRAVRLKVDFGFNGAVRLTDAAWRRLLGRSRAASSATETGPDGVSRTTSTTPAALRLGDGLAATVPVDDGWSAAEGADGLLGMAVLARGNVILDVPRGQLILLPAPGGDGAPAPRP